MANVEFDFSGGTVIVTGAAHAETRPGRRMRFFTRVDDRPGALAELLALVAEMQANVIAVDHVRDGVPQAVGETGIELGVETAGAELSSRSRSSRSPPASGRSGRP